MRTLLRGFQHLGLLLCLPAILVSHLGLGFQPANARARLQGPATVLDPAKWIIGPIVFGENQSRGLPLHPQKDLKGGFRFDIPLSPGSAHYITFHYGSLSGKRRLIMRYRVELEAGARIVPVSAPEAPSIITLYFQRRGDDWSGMDEFETYRWYATFASQMPITSGNHQIVAALNENWTAIQTSSARRDPTEFAAAIADADQVGFVLGGGTGYGHGVYATGNARIFIDEFKVQ